MTAGAIALAVITPAFDPVEHTAEAVDAVPPIAPIRAESARLGPDAAFQERAVDSERASRTAARRAVQVRPAGQAGPTVRSPYRTTNLVAARMARIARLTEWTAARENALGSVASGRNAEAGTETARRNVQVGALATRQSADDGSATSRRNGEVGAAAFRRNGEVGAAASSRNAEVGAAASRRNAEVQNSGRSDPGSSRSGQIRRATREVREVRAAIPHRYTVRAVVTKHAVDTHATRRVSVGGGMSAVIAFARSQVGRRYVTGGEGGDGFDCSGLTKRAYALAGISLPHSSGAQAARARAISRSAARPGDLVVGRGHVGIYMGHGMMIDAGNHHTGVVYRKLYSGLRVGRL